jgi:hypothetical protein
VDGLRPWRRRGPLCRAGSRSAAAKRLELGAQLGWLRDGHVGGVEQPASGGRALQVRVRKSAIDRLPARSSPPTRRVRVPLR